MQQFAKFALGLAALLAVGIAVNARWGDSFEDPSPAAKQMREQFEAIETSAGVPVERHGCQTLRQFVATKPFFYQCPMSAAQLDALRPVLLTRGWQAAPGSAPATLYTKGVLQAHLSCEPGGTACVLRIETTPAPATS